MKFIAELCQNHNGNSELLKNLVLEAAGSGATHIKIQHIYAKNLTFRPVFENGFSLDGATYAIRRPFEDEYVRLKSLELDQIAVSHFIEQVTSLGLTPLTTIFTLDTIESVYEQGFREVKIASYDAASYPLIKACLDRFDHVYISTGATFDSEIQKLYELTKPYANITVLHCVTSYPTSREMMNLSRINYLKKLGFSNVGYSDHSAPCDTSLDACFVAITLGASVVERHFTILPKDQTKDGKVSVNPQEFRAIVDFNNLSDNSKRSLLQKTIPSDVLEMMLGSETRDLSHIELLNREYYRGRFATPRVTGNHFSAQMRFNWEEA